MGYISFTCTCIMINHVCDNYLRQRPTYYGYLHNMLCCIVLAEYKAMIEDRGNICFTTRSPTPCLRFISSHCNSEDQSPKKEKATLKVFLTSTDSCRDLLDWNKADLCYWWLHTSLENLSSSGQWHPQSPRPDWKALWCLAPSERIETQQRKQNDRKGIMDLLRLNIVCSCGKYCWFISLLVRCHHFSYSTQFTSIFSIIYIT